ncbi:hypothetical protein LPU83_pLPU83d_0615 (plasmid) [Rhizobium favelukesii]|uniref:Uncharacterized protein n=1 Tax=Rhizobium favelukesii TaxID=348824 RepID=W6S730_9HYPH|nr:hypothetical protein LPU83_pLPU83d_0615 [Rhizobium favelukesii]
MPARNEWPENLSARSTSARSPQIAARLTSRAASLSFKRSEPTDFPCPETRRKRGPWAILANLIQCLILFNPYHVSHTKNDCIVSNAAILTDLLVMGRLGPFWADAQGRCLEYRQSARQIRRDVLILRSR